MKLASTRPLLVLLLCVTAVCPLAAQPATPAAALPPMPKGQSPVALFRQLIGATPAEADQLLAGRPPEQRRAIETKLIEYRLLPPPLREWRLKATELRWYLVPLMRLPPANRGGLLLTVPDADRPLVEARLRQWDGLPAAEQQQLLNNELALRYVARPDTAPAPTPDQLQTLSAPDRARLEQAIAEWRDNSESRRQQLAERFSRFFKLTEQEQSRTLDLLTATEREQLRQTIDSFADLPPAERERCLQAVRQFSSLSREERLTFLQGAERWRNLSDTQRDSWRALVHKLPPLPPGAQLPPLPPGFNSPRPGASLPVPLGGQSFATNSL